MSNSTQKKPPTEKQIKTMIRKSLEALWDADADLSIRNKKIYSKAYAEGRHLNATEVAAVKRNSADQRVLKAQIKKLARTATKTMDNSRVLKGAVKTLKDVQKSISGDLKRLKKIEETAADVEKAVGFVKSAIEGLIKLAAVL